MWPASTKSVAAVSPARSSRRPSFSIRRVTSPGSAIPSSSLRLRGKCSTRPSPGDAIAWSVASVDPADIDRLNIHRASLSAMRQAVLALTPLPEAVLVDAFRIPDLALPQRGIVKGDRRSSAIAAASIVAKVTRDRQMDLLHAADPRFGFNHHKGYATSEHLAAVALHGYSPVHRRTFRPPSLFDTID